MTALTTENQTHAILGQKYAYATAALILGIACFVNLVGMEKAILAIVFARLALKGTPAPALIVHRAWAKTGLVLGTALLVIVPTIIILNLDRLRTLIEVLQRFSNGK